MQTDRLYLRINPDLKRTLEVLAQADRRQVSDYVRMILEDHIAKEFAKASAPTQERLAR